MPSAHGKITADRGIHSAISFIYANEAARLAAGPFEPEDLYKLAWQDDTNQIFILTTAAPAAWTIVLTTISAGDVDFATRKSSPGTIAPGSLVYVAGYDSVNNVILVELARSDNAATMGAIGVAIEAIDAGTGGLIRNQGLVTGVIDTSTFSVGANLYVSDTVAGGFRSSPPAGPNRAQAVGAVAVVGNPGVVYANTREQRPLNYPAAVLKGLGQPDAGVSAEAARADHVHPAESNDDHNFEGNDVRNFKLATSSGKIDKGNVSGSVTVDWTQGRKQELTLTANVTSLTFTDPPGDSNLILTVRQDATGGRALSGLVGSHFVVDGLASLSTGANTITKFYIEFDETDTAYYWSIGRDYSSFTNITAV